jgi:site-specific DNA-methyltransferase (adenine-specific)
MAERGWIIRNNIVWHKPDCMPESAKDRFTVDYEPVFFCTKNPQYYFKQQLQPYSDKTLKRCQRFVENGERFNPVQHKANPDCPSQAPMRVLERMSKHIVKNLRVPGRTTHTMHVDRANGKNQDIFNPAGANRRCVWRIPTAGYPGAHFAVFPEELAEICIDAGCPPGGRVLDPFLGAGTTGVVAERMGRDFFGIELNPENAQHAKERILTAKAKRMAMANGSPAGAREPTAAQNESAPTDGLSPGDDKSGSNPLKEAAGVATTGTLPEVFEDI